MHLDIAAVEILSFQPEDYFRTQVGTIFRMCYFDLYITLVGVYRFTLNPFYFSKPGSKRFGNTMSV